MEKTKKSWDFFNKKGKELLKINPDITPGEVRNVLEEEHGKMHWNAKGEVPKKGEKGYDYKFKPMGRDKKTGNKKPFYRENLEGKKNRNITNIANRGVGVKQQTVGDKTFPKPTKATKGLELHHKRGLNFLRSLYNGLNKEEAKELSEFFVKNGFPLGDKYENVSILPKGPHRHLHRYMEKEGYTEGKLPDFKNKSLAQRKEFAKKTLFPIFADTDRKSMKIMQDYARKYPEKYKGTYGDALKINKNIKLGRKALKLLPLGALGGYLSGLEAKEREALAAKTGNRLDKIQAGISRFEQATDYAGAVPGPQSLITEPAGLAAAGTNLFLDAARFKRDGPMLGSRSRFKLRDK